MATEPTLIIMPILGAQDLTRAAIADCLAQSVPIRLLLINQGVADDFREELEKIAEEYADRILLWSHQPPMQSLAATWNRALDFAWACGGEEALVINNDVRIAPGLVWGLHCVLTRESALFVSAVGVAPADWAPDRAQLAAYSAQWPEGTADYPIRNHGGPDFSCFLISHACHHEFRFDEHFIPAYCEDLDYHRRLLLAGCGADIFSVNLPYLHYAAGTLKSVDPAKKAQIERGIAAGSRQYYLKKWGGPVNAERFFTPFDEPMSAEEDDRFYGWSREEAATPCLQAHPPTDSDSAMSEA